MPRPFADTLRSPAALARFVLTAAVGLSADLYTKQLAADRLGNGAGRRRPSRGGCSSSSSSNPGAVFGIAPGQRWAFLIVSAAAIAFLTYLFAGSGRRWFYQVVLGVLLAGVLGNMYDRVVYGVGPRHDPRPARLALAGRRPPRPAVPAADVFPYIFNVADSLLCVGVGVMLVYSFVTTPPAPAGPPVVAPADAPTP